MFPNELDIKKKRSYRRINNVVNHISQGIKLSRKKHCGKCIYRNNCSEITDMEDIISKNSFKLTPNINKNKILKKLESTPKGFGIPGEFFSNQDIFDIEMEYIFHNEWVFAGHGVQLQEKGTWFTMNVGKNPILIIKGDNNEIKAYHNICRHRGLKLCEGNTGKLDTKNIICDYHNWTYDINDGSLKKARDMEKNNSCGEFCPEQLGLFPVHIKIVSNYIFVCVAKNPPNFDMFSKILENYSEPYALDKTKIAYQSRIIEECNWKLTWENNRECYHCISNHPELIQSFPGNWIQSEDGDFSDKEKRDLVEKLDLPYKFISSQDYQYRIMRHLFIKDSLSMTKSGKPAIKNNKRLGRMPINENIGNVAFYHYPSTWNHWQADYAITFRVVPISPTQTELVTTWLVPENAIEGIDYDLTELTEVWIATNEQDKSLVERVQQGVSSPTYKPGPFNEQHEIGVIEFVEWYIKIMKDKLTEK